MDGDNGNRDANGNLEQSQVIITLDRANFRIAISGSTENHDEALAMLAMAQREIEKRIRAAEIQQVLQAPASGHLPPVLRRH